MYLPVTIAAMTDRVSFRNIPLILVFILMALLSACSLQSSGPLATATSAEPATTPTTAPLPTTTPEPEEIWLVASPQVDPVLLQEVTAWLEEQAASEGFNLRNVDSFLTGEVNERVKVVVSLTDIEDIENLAANFPDLDFIVFSEQEISTAENLSVIRSDPNLMAFLAGYLATLNAPDFRSGGLFMDQGDHSARLQESFLNGGRYLCGRCSPVYAPIVAFPQVGLVPAGADAAGWQAAFDTLNQHRIEMLYVPAEGLQPAFLDYLMGQNVGLISNGAPPPGYESLWVASVMTDSLSALQELWPEISAGSSGREVQADLILANINRENLSPGRQQLAEILIPELISGAIVPLSVP